MNGTRTILVAVLALLLVLSALPAAAVSFHSGPYNAQKNGSAGTASKQMTPRNTTFCFLSSVAFEDIDTTGERATCRVVRGTYVWVLEAYLPKSDDHDAYCSAICYNN